ncbi:nicotinamide N-methyltransferase [Rhodotorula toruloides]|uniref:Nicotinamide N-methyltransferase n=1 Tax=Rhodotorula toruloides TaxID=5286 RepID=A0A511K8R7_RHOTO|nr:nicotinamide N-methyltransferase [Rhodotorula toruloides]
MSSSAKGSDDEGFGAVFEEPEGFRPATPPPTVRNYKRRKYGGVGELIGPEKVEVGLVSGHPLWGHILYPAAIALSQFLELHASSLLHGLDGKGKGRGKAVLELGAGGGLPGLTAALEGAGTVVISDFPDAALVKNIGQNVETNIAALNSDFVAETSAKGFTWGSPPDSLLEVLGGPFGSRKFDLILLSDLVFNHSQHAALLNTCLSCLSTASPQPLLRSQSTEAPPCDLSDRSTLSSPAVLCFFSHHRPWLVEADLAILDLAREKGWKVTKVWEDPEAGPAFPEDGGDLAIRSTVHGWMFTRGK